MNVTANHIRSFAVLLAFWLLLSGSVAVDVLLVGFVVSALVVLVFRDGLSFLSGLYLTPAALMAALGFVGYFLKELVKSNLQLAAIVLQPSLPIAPAIVRVRTSLDHPVARLVLANAITLTPGTLSVEMKGDHLYIHWVVAQDTDTESATQAIVAGYERYLEAMYG